MNTFIIKNINIVTEFGIIDNGFLYVKRGIIRNVGRAKPDRVHRSCRMIDGQCAFLMPGFIDMYNGQLTEAGDFTFHSVENSLYRHGITSVLHMVPESEHTDNSKWNQLRRLGLINHHFTSKLPIQNSYYLIGAKALHVVTSVNGSKIEAMQELITDNPTISDVVKHPSMYVICSDSSETSLLECVQTLVRRYPIRYEDAIGMISINPARALGIDSRLGSIERGKRADMLLVDNRQDRLEISKVYVNGCIIYSKGEEDSNIHLYNHEGDRNGISHF